MAQQSRIGSITPTTFKGFTPISVEEGQAQIEFGANTRSIALLRQKQQEFNQASLAVTHDLKAATDGIIDHSRLTRSELEFLAFSTEFEDKITRLDTYARLVGNYEKFLATNKGLNLYCNVEYANSTTSVHRFGIDIDSLSPSQSNELAGIFDKTVARKAGSVSSATSKKALDYPHILHPLEVFQIKEAIQHSTTRGHKTVLVDIFERNEDGSIVIGTDKKPGIHTIVLCMQDNQILVIDPSNSDFSKHLAYNGDVICGYDRPMRILVSDSSIQIYAPPSKTPVGPNPNEYRDCKDIAVKLAFGLERQVGQVDMKKLAELNVVQEITNQDSINDKLFFDSKKAIARVRQASEDAVREKAQKLMASIDKQSKCAKLYGIEALKDKIIKEGSNFFALECLCDQYHDHLQALEAAHQANIDLVGQMMKDAVV